MAKGRLRVWTFSTGDDTLIFVVWPGCSFIILISLCPLELSQKPLHAGSHCRDCCLNKLMGCDVRGTNAPQEDLKLIGDPCLSVQMTLITLGENSAWAYYIQLFYKLLLFSRSFFSQSLHSLAVSTHSFDSTQLILVLVYNNLFSFESSELGEKSTTAWLTHRVQIKY